MSLEYYTLCSMCIVYSQVVLLEPSLEVRPFNPPIVNQSVQKKTLFVSSNLVGYLLDDSVLFLLSTDSLIVNIL